LKSHDDKSLIHQNHNVVKKQFNSITETVDCKQLVLCTIIKVLIIHETTYNLSSQFVIELINILQQENKFTVRIKADEMMNIQKNDVKI